MADEPVSPAGSKHPTKRRRIALACTACRSRKSRCNGARPRCSLCDSLGFECVYEASESSTNLIVPKDFVGDLADRLKALEERVARHDAALAEHAIHVSERPSTAPEQSESSRLGQVHSRSAADFDRTPISLDDADLQELPPEEHQTDGMAMSFLDEEDCGFFGPSSNISLMRHISWLVTQASQPASSETTRWGGALLDSGVVSTTRLSSPIRDNHSGKTSSFEQCSPLFLPSEADTRRLVSYYFTNTGLLFPYLHEASFISEYDQLVANGFKRARRTWLGLLHMVLAMSSNTLAVHSIEEREQRNVESEMFYRCAMLLCDRQALRGTSVETVQYLLLMTQYLQGTQMSFQTWTIHGLAIKAALSLGLHSMEASRKLAPLEQEIRKRAWYGCIVLDRSLSMTFGRPAAIPVEYIRLPLPSNLPTSTDSDRIDHQDMSTKFFNATINLYETLYHTIAQLYGHNLGCDPPLDEAELLDRIFRLERELSRWESGLPSGLAVLKSADLPLQQPVDPIQQRFCVVLTLRKLNLEILIHRPALIRTVDLVKDSHLVATSGFVEGMRQSSIRSCVKSAESIINLVHHLVTSESPLNNLLGAWWYSLYYVFNSALIIFGHFVYLQFQTDSIRPIWECSDSIRKATEALQHLGTGNATIKRCNDHLLQLSQLLQDWSARSLHSSMVYSNQQPLEPLSQITSLQQPTAGVEMDDFSDTVQGFDPGLFNGNGLELNHFCLPGDFSTLVLPSDHALNRPL
ncbi:hypothetical protein JX265_012966 [Neoarthrinium moseri]|uniref:Zn(2)-C6 fungal-type domain-containing protein n=1 Tax=Neoarthrinium moseri TaxID=1658444 RepID=A0A9Q0AJ39_9PEZI|nr:uncharacterized protein JN550_002877 [Neoarthrinium moseri]KAI1852938.1 hypothetical protein JX265_012966 [Neoarthrinium moseri]KAI1874298.1 hypothetical protein JN550_002877 [Neoarthrinium moseri]